MTDPDAEPTVCRLCGAPQPEFLGALADSDFFAGRVLAQPLAGGGLWRCRRCESMFRHPVLEPDAYLRLYEAGAAGQWHGDEGRRDLPQIRRLISERPETRSVLDVGCGTGDFVASLPRTIEKFGIEPSLAAAAQAATQGVIIAAAALERLPRGRCFDVITLIDVIEHVPEPATLLQLAASYLRPGGVILVSTGDPQSKAWHWFAARFWYAAYPEHVSFPSEQFFELWLADHGGGQMQRLRTRYQSLPMLKWLLYGTIQIAYYLSPALFNRVGRLGGQCAWGGAGRQYFAPSAPGVFIDHQVVTLQCASPPRKNRKSA